MTATATPPVVDEFAEIPDPQTARGRFAIAVRHHGKASSEALSARQNLAEANIGAAIRRVLAESPPLRPEQIRRLVVLLDES